MGETVPVLFKGEQIHVHKEVLTSTSDFLKIAMKPEWRTDENRPIDLTEEDAKAVEAYCRWLYSHTIPCHDDILYTTRLLCQLFVLGEKLLDQTLKNAVLAMMIEGAQTNHRYLCSRPLVKLIYDGTPKGSPVRRLMVDLYVYIAHSVWLSPHDCASFRGTDFLEELVPALLSARPQPSFEKGRPWVVRPESYREGAFAYGNNVETGSTKST
ncbi:hypothetical protein COCCADRAFT_40873 [Bipolaris zeicola 26-R-13]|uniref:BTB domain-containing protein n=1 Tax=Cochliobolus carbonum (strain 26-R-13) TaxID=930089 RepID=W6XMV5_COCC2|nr:uncharacterized protein COCCADRAFT_40873 [Bipolaris zeicola 26-R-13]EUC28627.1 hypothetical protein COCCADRAFT_40873 [Bipolaris zeicola 26-R-13]